MQPLCFILMPFGIKKDQNGKDIDFDNIYSKLIKPSIIDAGLEPIRADEEMIGGIIHKPMYERLMLCEYAVADLSILNANVFYELGIRHSFRPHSTITIFEEKSSLPFDTNFLRSLPYDRELEDLEKLREQLTSKLLYAKENKDTIDSPLFQLVEGIKPSNIEHIKTDVFREQVQYNQALKEKLLNAKDAKSKEQLQNIESSLGDFSSIEFGVVIDLYLSYREIKAYDEMIELEKKMPEPLRKTIMVQEQLGLALNRIGDQDKAIRVLEAIIEAHGKSSETNGILGRVYKDKYSDALKKGNEILAKGFLTKAIDTYIDGFEADFRDAYPGINALTLLDIADEKDRFNEIYPVVLYAVKQKLKKNSDYWDYATLLELYVLKEDMENALEIVSEVVVNKRFDWEIETTVNNLNIIKARRAQKAQNVHRLNEVIDKLQH